MKPKNRSVPISLRWAWYAWAELTPDVLYQVLRLRSAIFVVEQDCVFPDMDGRDPQCEHLCGWRGNELTAYLRLVPPGVRTPEVALGRVVVAKPARGTGLGRAVMLEGLARCAQRYPGQPSWHMCTTSERAGKRAGAVVRVSMRTVIARRGVAAVIDSAFQRRPDVHAAAVCDAHDYARSPKRRDGQRMKGPPGIRHVILLPLDRSRTRA